MDQSKFLIVCLFFLSQIPAISQTSIAQGSSAPSVVASVSREEIDETLARYTNAYAKKSIDDLLAVYPEFKNAGKEFKRVKERFADDKISSEQVKVQVLDVQGTGDVAHLHCKRNEQYVKAETRDPAIYSGLWRVGVPTEGSSSAAANKLVKKSETVWITLRKAGDTWSIASISDKNPQ